MIGWASGAPKDQLSWTQDASNAGFSRWIAGVNRANVADVDDSPAPWALRGILVDTPDSNTAPDFDATVVGNTVHMTDNVNAVAGLVVQSRQGVVGQASTMCADVRNNVVDFPNGTPGGVNGIRVRQTAAAAPPGAATPVAVLERGVSTLATPVATALAPLAVADTPVAVALTPFAKLLSPVAVGLVPLAFRPTT